MNVDASDENSDVADVTIEVEEKPAPLEQLKKFEDTDSGVLSSALFALLSLGVSLAGTFILIEAVLGRGVMLPKTLWGILLLVPVLVGMASIAPLRAWFLTQFHSPRGRRISRRIRFLGAMLLLLVALLGFCLLFRQQGSETDRYYWQVVRARECLLLASWLVLGLLMRFFPRGELE